MITRIRKSIYVRGLALLLCLNLVFDVFYPTMALALTGGPSQPEVQSFEPIGTSEMVDLFSGDFTYNIPLMDVGGYPLNISYNSGITMDQEASWVGLGWNLNPGAITRNMRGLADDFRGDEVVTEQNMKANNTYGITGGFGVEAFGHSAIGASYSMGINYNTYNGVGFEQTLSPTFSMGMGNTEGLTANLGFALNGSSSEGPSIAPSISFSDKIKTKKKEDVNLGSKVGVAISSRGGLSQLTIGVSGSLSETSASEAKKNPGLKDLKNSLKDGGEGDKDNVSVGMTGGFNGGSSISIGGSTYMPQVDMARINTNFSFSAKFGGSFFGLDGTYNLGGYFSSSVLKNKTRTLPAYGYLHSQGADEESLHDFNREKDGAFNKHSYNLPITNYTYDVFTIAGQGIGGMFRPFRGELGHVHDPLTRSISASGSLGAELSPGNLVHVGVDVNLNGTDSHSGDWSDENLAWSNTQFKDQIIDNADFEQAYFKEAGEKTVDEDNFYTNIGGNTPYRLELYKTLGNHVVIGKTNLINKSGTTKTISAGGLKRTQRVKRNQAITYLTAGEAQYFGTFKYVSPYSKAHHIAEIDVLRKDGARYIYGIAAYNTVQKEVTFNASGLSGNCGTGLVGYSAVDASKENSRGTDNYFSSTKTPPYAHSYLLTSVLSPDYSDVDGVTGPSPGDLGSYTKFDYDAKPTVNGIQAYDPSYKWRTPFPSGNANYNEGLKSDKNDDKGSYVYGEKEMWYLEKIETKTYVAVFHKSNSSDPRKDSRGVTAETGGISTTDILPRLDSISLYALPDYLANPATAEPIKRVHFEYDYTLCKGTSNNSNGGTGSTSGKLTLKKIYFTYGKSYKGRLNAYEFVYADNNNDGTEDANPNYNIKGYDRWGNYKPNGGSCDPETAGLTAPEYPYVEQDQTTANSYAASWNLSKIKLPSGGEIVVNYESDDYAYVQNKHAMQMFKIVGAGSSTSSMNGELYTGTTPSSNTPHKYLFFNVPSTATTSEIQTKYLRDVDADDPIYFRFLTSLTDGDPGTHEYVSGYFYLDTETSGYYGVATIGGTKYGYIRVKAVGEGDSGSNVHPVTKAAWHFGRKYNPRLVYNLPDPGSGFSVEDVFNTLASASLIGGVAELIGGANNKLHKKNYAREFIANKSWIRLYNPDGKRLGGGARVKTIEVNDKWATMETEGTSSNFGYGQKYEYTLPDGTSSGVAANEPQLGGDENVLHQPIFIDQKVLLAPDESNYVEEPFGESFYPSPSVGYSRVKVTSLAKDKAVAAGGTLNRHGTGYVLHEYYTAKDFPVITDRTDLDKARKAPSALGQLLKLRVTDYMTASQGFTIELNDMHGKPKAQWVYAEGQTQPISGVEYKYQTKEETKTLAPFGSTITTTVLDNNVVVIKPDGTVTGNTAVGVDFDVVNDYREAKTHTYSVGGQGNLAVFLAAVIPITVPTIFPQFGYQTTRFRSAVTTKVINRYGILKETIAYDLGSKVSTENLAYDAQTGEVLLTKTKNGYDDYVYNFNYPAHWAYDRMGQAYKNIGMFMEETAVTGGTPLTTEFSASATSKFVKGDEVMVYEDVSGSIILRGKAWVWDDDENNANGQYLIDENGNSFFTSTATRTVRMKVLRSGRRNMQALAVGSVTSMVNPIDINNDGTLNNINTGTPFTSVIDANAVEYSENWGLYCNPKQAYEQNTCGACAANFTYFNEYIYYFNSVLEGTGTICESYTVPGRDYSGILPPDWVVNSGTSGCSGNTTFVAKFTIDGLPHPTVCNVTFYCVDGNGETITLPSGFNWDDLFLLSNYSVSSKDENGDCIIGDSYYISASGFFNNGTSTNWANVLIEVGCGPVGNCQEVDPCTTLDNSVINPYVLNVRGNWRSKKSYLHLTDRDKITASAGGYTDINTRKSGLYNSFSAFWTPPGGSSLWTPNTTNWTWTSEVTKYSPYGFEIENKDALNRYSGAVFGYNHTLAKAVASNARYNEIAFDGFEDYDLIFNEDCCQDQFSFYDDKTHITSTIAHTGRRSMQLIPITNPDMTYTCSLTVANPTPEADDVPYTVKPADQYGYFGPLKSTETVYVLTYWVKANCPGCASSSYQYSFDDVTPLVKVDGTTITSTLVDKGEIIDGWQRHEYKFTVPVTGTNTAEVKFVNASNTKTYYVDDIRLHPFNASMKSFVYDPITYRLMAELDERNFATFYEYDESGALIRIKKETEKGIMTIQESKSNNFKKKP